MPVTLVNDNLKSNSIILENEAPSEDELSVYSNKIEESLSRFRQEHNDQPNADIIRCVKRVIFGDKRGFENENLEMLAITFRKIVEICNSTPDEYNRFWNVKTNKKMYLENLSRKITAMASDQIKEECAFQRKRILFKIVYPEYYEANFPKIKPYDLFHIGGRDKADLIKAAKPLLHKEEKEDGGPLISDGAIVDRLMMKTIDAAFETANITNKATIMEILADRKKIRNLVNSSIGQKATVPGCFLIINERKCYESYLDFYFLNLSKEEQIFLADDYMEIRRNANIPPNPLLDKLYKIYQENQEAFFHHLDEKDY